MAVRRKITGFALACASFLWNEAMPRVSVVNTPSLLPGSGLASAPNLMLTFQQIILKLQSYWDAQGCALL